MKKITLIFISILLVGCSNELPNRSFEYFSKKDVEYTSKFNSQLEKLFKSENKEFNLPAVMGSLPKYSPVEDPFQIGSFGVGGKRSDNDVDGEFHTGADLISLSGNTNVYATSNGIVVYQDSNPKHGNIIVIRHTNGIETLYTHLENILVKVADKVTINTQIGQYGMSGESTQAHLHYEILVGGYPVNPIKATQLSPEYVENESTEKTENLFSKMKNFRDSFISNFQYKAVTKRDDKSNAIFEATVSYKENVVAIKLVRFYGNASKEEEILNDCKFFDRKNWNCKHLFMTDGHLFLEEPYEKSVIYLPRTR